MGKRSKASWCGEGKRARVLVLVLAKDPEKKVIFAIFKCKVATLSFLSPYWVVGSKQTIEFLKVTVWSYILQDM